MKKGFIRLISWGLGGIMALSSMPISANATGEDKFISEVIDMPYFDTESNNLSDIAIEESCNAEQGKSVVLPYMNESQIASFDGITPAFSSNEKVDKILEFAYSKIHSSEYSGYCQAFVKACYEYAGIVIGDNASTANEAKRRWGISNDFSNIPVGACVYFISSEGGGNGHVALYTGNGKIVHTVKGVYGDSNISYVEEMNLSYYLNRGVVECWGYQAGYDLYSNSSSTPNVGVEMEHGYYRTIPDGDYYIVSAVNSDLTSILDVPGNTFDEPDGETVEIWSNFGSLYDIFSINFVQTDDDGRGFYQILHKNTNKRLDVYDGGKNKNSKVQFWTGNDSIAQHWAFSYVGDGWYNIQARCNGYSLDVTGASAEDGTIVELWEHNDSAAQKWAFIPVGASTIEEGNYRIAFANDSSKILGVVNDVYVNDENYNNAELQNISYEKDTVFSVQYLPDEGSYCIKQKSTGVYLDIQKGGAISNVGVYVGNPDGSPFGRWQKWVIRKSGDNYNIISRHKGLFLDLYGAIPDLGTNIQVWESNLSSAQQWKFLRAVDDVSLNKTELSIKVKEKQPLVATVIPSSANNKELTWNSNNTAVATVDENGTITGVGEGVAMISVVTVDGGYNASCTVTVEKSEEAPDPVNPNPENPDPTNPNPIDPDPVDPDPTNPVPTDPDPVIPTPTPSYKTIVISQPVNMDQLTNKTYSRYTVLPKGYATVSSKGILKAKKTGEIIITGLIKSGRKWIPDTSNPITVYAEKPSYQNNVIQLNHVGATYESSNNLISTSTPSSWTISNKKIATIDVNTGLVTVLKSGKVKVTALFGEGKTAAKYSYTVNAVVPVMSKKNVSLLTGATTTIKLNKATGIPAWSSSDESIAVVDYLGVIKGISSGNAIITATLDGVDYQCNITVKKPTLSIKQANLSVGKTKKITLKNSKLNDVVWVSSNNEVATVNENGIISAISPGTAEISTTTGGCMDFCVVIVR